MARVIWNLQASGYAALRQNPVSARLLAQENQALIDLLCCIPQTTFQCVLDVGTGTGNALAMLFQAGLKAACVYAIDSAEKMLREVQKKFPSVQCLVAEAENLPFRNETFDLVLCIGVSEYVKSLPELMRELSRVLQPKGFLVITAATPMWLNRMRYALLHTLFLRDEREVQASFQQTHFAVLEKRQTLLQMQFLLQKVPSLV